MQTLDDFFSSLNAAVKSTDCVDNDFFRAFRAQQLDVDGVQRFADQYFLYIRTFPQILAGLAHRVDNEEIRRELAKTIVSELGGGGEGGMGHYKMFQNACSPLGIDIAEAARSSTCRRPRPSWTASAPCSSKAVSRPPWAVTTPSS